MRDTSSSTMAARGTGASRSSGGLLLRRARGADRARPTNGCGEAEADAQCIAQSVLDSSHVYRVAELRGKRGDLPVRDSARDHLAEPAKVCVDVQRQPVGGHTPLDADADGGQLPTALDPYADQAILRVRLDPEGGCGLDDRGLQGADVSAQVERVAQLDDGVGHKLARPVERDVAAAVHA